MTAFEEWWDCDTCTDKEKEEARFTWNAAMKEAARICRELKPSTMPVVCEICATKIEQSGG